MKHYLGIDLGGTNIAVGLVDEHYRIVEFDSVKTNAPRPAQALVDDMAAVCRRLCAEHDIPLAKVEWVGIGTPGITWNGTLYLATNLELADVPLAAMLSEAVGRPAFLQNDANTAAYGEYLAGAGKGCHSMVIMTIGTGIGSGVIIDGRIHDGFNGAASELGHIILQPGGKECPCGRKGCAEQYCSASALGASTRAAMQRHPESAMWKLAEGKLENAGAKTPFAAKLLGDFAGTTVVEEFLDYLAICASTAINLLQPEVFCVGGGVSKEGDAIILPLRERLESLTFAGRDGLRTKVVTARLGNDAGIVGAAMLGAMK